MALASAGITDTAATTEDESEKSNVLKGPVNLIGCRLKDPTGLVSGPVCSNAGTGYSLQWGFLPKAAADTGAAYLLAVGLVGMTTLTINGPDASGAISVGVLLSPLPGITIGGIPVTFSLIAMVDALAYNGVRWSGFVVLYVRQPNVTTGIAATIHIW